MAVTAPVSIGVDEDGRFALQWLAAPLVQALGLTRSHALLVHGAAGAGQFEFAQTLAQAWLCESAATSASAPCGRCAACRQVRSRSHPDLLLVVPEALRLKLGWVGEEEPLNKQEAKPSKDIRIDQIRQAIEWSQRTPARGRAKAMVLHPADSMNAASANALLKTLEEPPGSLKLVLCTDDPARLLPTVRSRCQQVRLVLPTLEQASAWLHAKGVDDAGAVLRLAGGSPVVALQLSEEGIDQDFAARLPGSVAAGDAGLLAGRPVPRALELMLKLAHDTARIGAGGLPLFFAPGSLRPAASADALIRWQRNLLRVARHDDHPWNAGLLIEALVTEGARAWAAPASRPSRDRPHSLHSSR